MSSQTNPLFLKQLTTWKTPSSWQTFHTIDMHTCGEPLRIIISGQPKTETGDVLAYRRNMKQYHDQIRKLLMWEPRGHADMYGCYLIPSSKNDADFGVIFLHNEGYSTMCGHAIIALATLAAENNIGKRVENVSRINIETPAGLVHAYAHWEGNRVTHAYFDNVPSFLAEKDGKVLVRGIGEVIYDLAFGGAFYAYVDAQQIDLSLDAGNTNQIIDWGRRVKQAVINHSRLIVHPYEEDLSFLYGTIFIGPSQGSADNRNVCIFADGEVDRSPTGTGVSGRMAIHHHKNEIKIGEWMTIESIIGSSFKAQVKQITQFGPYEAIIPRVEGSAYVTGRHEFILDPNDPLSEGFLLR